MTSSLLPDSTGRRIVAPYITAWSEEVDLPHQVIEIPGRGIGYADESAVDRDRHGVLWFRTANRMGVGRPVFARVHPVRQRRAMLRLLCGVCGGPASRTDAGVLWLVRDFRDWPGWPERMVVTEPPVCVPCLGLSIRLCPDLRRGAVAFRAQRFPVFGVRGSQYATGPRPVGEATVAFDDPAVRWVRATNLLRELHDCTVVDVDEVVSTCPT